MVILKHSENLMIIRKASKIPIVRLHVVHVYMFVLQRPNRKPILRSELNLSLLLKNEKKQNEKTKRKGANQMSLSL